uniref:Uncharacterized protein n=1 Tax=Onchocerca volvulus TaxID=6282 RepID=A0A8R1Y2F2_ONCVO
MPTGNIQLLGNVPSFRPKSVISTMKNASLLAPSKFRSSLIMVTSSSQHLMHGCECSNLCVFSQPDDNLLHIPVIFEHTSEYRGIEI